MWFNFVVVLHLVGWPILLGLCPTRQPEVHGRG